MINSIYSKPSGICATYRPAILNAFAGNPDIIYCDVYFEDVYYKTLVSSSPTSVYPFNTAYAFYTFDLQHVAQEYLAEYYAMPQINLSAMWRADPLSKLMGYTKCTCRLRGSMQTNGVWSPEGYAIPVQGTADTEPISGGGLLVDAFYFLNASPQFEDWGTFDQYLRHHCQNHYIIRDKAVKIYTLQTNEEENVYLDDYNYMTVLLGNNCFEGVSSPNSRYCTLRAYLSKPGTTDVITIHQNQLEVGNRMLYIPSGIPNLKGTVAGASVDFSQYDYYYVCLQDTTYSDTPNNMFANLVARSPKYRIIKNKNSNKRRLWFRNDLGVMQAVSFQDYTEELTVSSGVKMRPQYPLTNSGFNGQEAGYQRKNVRSNEVTTAIGLFSEKEMDTISQLVKSSVAFYERPAITYEAYNPAPPSNPAKAIQVRILDSTVVKRKVEDRYVYEVNIQYENSMSNLTVQ